MSAIQTLTDALNQSIKALLAAHAATTDEAAAREIHKAITAARHAVLKANDPEPIRCVRICRRSNSKREYFVIEVRTHDLTLSCDLVNERQIRLARKLAKDHGVELDFLVDPAELPV